MQSKHALIPTVQKNLCCPHCGKQVGTVWRRFRQSYLYYDFCPVCGCYFGLSSRCVFVLGISTACAWGIITALWTLGGNYAEILATILGYFIAKWFVSAISLFPNLVFCKLHELKWIENPRISLRIMQHIRYSYYKKKILKKTAPPENH